jgi:formylglycine-generating enzyme required for sulfatase activity
LNKAYSFVPSGIVKIDKDTFFLQSFYMKNHEVSNADYQVYLTTLQKENDSEGIQVARIRNENWEKQLQAKDFAEHYHTHPGYSDYPVVNVSYFGALGYCEFMTKKLNLLFKKTGLQIKVRLPFHIEIIRAGIGDNHLWMYPWEGSATISKRGELLSNHKNAKLSGVAHNKQGKQGPLAASKYLSPVASFDPSSFGIHNLSGNAAEMTNVPGVAVGGSFQDSSDDVKLKSQTTYQDASCFVGFRVVFTWQAE